MIEPLPVVLAGGPDDAQKIDVVLIYPIHGMRAMRSHYRQGFYWLPGGGGRDDDTGRLIAAWHPHDDWAFPWIKDMGPPAQR